MNVTSHLIGQWAAWMTMVADTSSDGIVHMILISSATISNGIYWYGVVSTFSPGCVPKRIGQTLGRMISLGDPYHSFVHCLYVDKMTVS